MFLFKPPHMRQRGSIEVIYVLTIDYSIKSTTIAHGNTAAGHQKPAAFYRGTAELINHQEIKFLLTLTEMKVVHEWKILFPWTILKELFTKPYF